jgi:hypothetical protein
MNRVQCDAQRLGSIIHSYSFSAAGALCKEWGLSTLLFIACAKLQFLI